MPTQPPQERPPRIPQDPGESRPSQDPPLRREGVEREPESYDDELDPITRRNGQRETDYAGVGARRGIARRAQAEPTYDDERAV